MEPAPDLVTRFFSLLDERQLDACAGLLDTARAEGGTDAGWLDYLQAILHSEQSPPRWDMAQQTLRHALASNPAADLAAWLHLELAYAADYLGQYAEALEHNRLSLTLFEKLGDRTYQAKVLKNTGIAHTRAYERGQVGREALTAALTCHERSLVLCQTLGAERLQATVELELGTVYKSLGQWEAAAALYAARPRNAGASAGGAAWHLTLNNLGEVHHHLEQWEPAAACYTEALAILDSLEATDPYEEADVRSNLARLYQAQGRTEEALRASDHAIRLIEIMRTPLGGEEARIGFFGTRISIYDQRIGLELDRDCPAAGLTFLERAKSRSFIELLAHRQQALGAGHATDEQASFQEVNPLSALDIQQRLPPDTLLLEYFIAPGRACVFVVTTDRIAAVPLDPSLHAGLPNVLEPGRQRLLGLAPDARGHLHEPWPLRHLYRMLIAPVADRLRTRRRVCIVPHGALHYLPFHALLGSTESESHYLIEDQDVPQELIYAPSATVLLDVLPQQAGKPRPGRPGCQLWTRPHLREP